MAEYFYTVASLPMLSIEQEPPITVDYFLESCKYTLKDSDYKEIIKSIDRNAKTDNKTVLKWRTFDRSLRNELVRMRAAKMSKDADRYLHQGESTTGVFDSAREAFNAPNPKAGEDVLNLARWKFLDEMESSHPFDLTKLIAYYLKLKIIERKANMNEKNGTEKYKNIYNKIADKIHQSYDGDNNGIK